MRQLAASVVLGSLSSQKLSSAEQLFLKKYKVPGVTLFKRNFSEDHISPNKPEIIRGLQSLQRDLPLVVAIDQEGGRVSRIKSEEFPDKGPALYLFDGSDEKASLKSIKSYGTSIANNLRDIGVNVNFAPTVDILSNPLNSGLGNRCFGFNSTTVTNRAGAFLQGLHEGKVLGCLKHFPGQGSETSDTHNEPVVINAPISRINKRELIPYKSLLSSVEMVMISHCIFSSIDTKPASTSHKIILELLRKDLKYDGLIVSDDFNMKAIQQDKDEWALQIIEAINAGIDLLLVCSGSLEDWETAIKVIEAEATRTKDFHNKLMKASSRVKTLRKKLQYTCCNDL